MKLKENTVKTIVMVECFARDCDHRKVICADFLVSLISSEKADEYKSREVDWCIEVSKDFVFMYYFKLKNAVRRKVRYVCTIDYNSGGHVYSQCICHVQVCSFLFRLVITVSLTLTIKVSFSQVNNEEENQKRKKMSQPGRRLHSMYARSDGGCKGELAQSQQVPERSE